MKINLGAKGLKQLKSKKATGHDDFPPKVVKDSADSVAQPLSYIINLSLSTEFFPTNVRSPNCFHYIKVTQVATLKTTDRYLFRLLWLKLQREMCAKGFPIVCANKIYWKNSSLDFVKIDQPNMLPHFLLMTSENLWTKEPCYKKCTMSCL